MAWEQEQGAPQPAHAPATFVFDEAEDIHLFLKMVYAAVQGGMWATRQIKIQEYIQKLLALPRYENKLNRYRLQVYSQNGEDGIIQEIFRRVGTVNKFFVEIGVGNGLENNTTNLLLNGWQGMWIEKDEKHIAKIMEKFWFLIEKKRLLINHKFITAENVELALDRIILPRDFDLLSIDVDGMDYWIWKAVKRYEPRVVAIEYNSGFPPPTKWVIKYDSNFVGEHGTMCHGASLTSLELLGNEKGYGLVACDVTGNNCFFVRKDLLLDRFDMPLTAENYYEPPRFYLAMRTGHTRDFIEFENI